MKKWIFNRFIKKWILKQIETKRESIITSINEKVDFPKMDEAQEEKLFNDVYNIIVYVIKVILVAK